MVAETRELSVQRGRENCEGKWDTLKEKGTQEHGEKRGHKNTERKGDTVTLRKKGIQE